MNAETHTPAAAAPQSVEKQIDQLATDLQTYAYRISALAVGMSDAIDLVAPAKESGKLAIGRLVSFTELVSDEAEKISDLGEQIERLCYGLRHGDMA